MAQKFIDQTTIQPDGKPGDDAFTAFATCNDNFHDAEGRLSALEGRSSNIGQDVADLKAGLQQETQLRTDADGALSQAIAAEVAARQSADAALGARIPAKNLLLNGDFGLWQRGTSFNVGGSSGGRYSADRWYINAGGGGTLSISRNALATNEYSNMQGLSKVLAKITLGHDGAASHFAVLEQRIENVHTLSGKSAVVSIRVYSPPGLDRYISVEMQQDFKTQVRSVTGTKKYKVVPGWNTIAHRVAIPSTDGITVGVGHSLTMTLWISGGANWNGRNDAIGPQPAGDLFLTDMQVELGDSPTAFEIRHPAAELALCQQYYEKSYTLGVYPGASSSVGRESVGNTAVTAGTTFATSKFKVEKRASPAVTVWSATTTPVSGAVGQDDGSLASNATLLGAGTGSFELRWTNTAGRWGGFFHWTADAEL